MSAQRKLRLPMTLKQYLKTAEKSCVRCMEIEDRLVAWSSDDSTKGLLEVAAFATVALQQMDHIFEALPESACPWVWPISTDERRLVAKLQQKHPADTETAQRVADLLYQFSEEATVDEVAQGAIKALKWAALRAEQAAKAEDECSAMSVATCARGLQ